MSYYSPEQEKTFARDKEAFQVGVGLMIDECNFPLSQEQLASRLEDIELALPPVDNAMAAIASGYDPQTRTVFINPLTFEYSPTHTIRHELFHGISGQDKTKSKVTKLGLWTREGELANLSWMNEANTEVLTCVLAAVINGFAVDLGKLTDSRDEWNQIEAVTHKDPDLLDSTSYLTEIEILFNTMKKVPIGTLSQAYLAQQDGDANMNMLHHTLVSACGINRVVDLRNITDLLDSGTDYAASRDEDPVSIQISERIKQEDK